MNTLQTAGRRLRSVVFVLWSSNLTTNACSGTRCVTGKALTPTCSSTLHRLTELVVNITAPPAVHGPLTCSKTQGRCCCWHYCLSVFFIKTQVDSCQQLLHIITDPQIKLYRHRLQASSERQPTASVHSAAYRCHVWLWLQNNTRKPSYRWLTRATRKPAKNCSNSTCLQRCRWQY